MEGYFFGALLSVSLTLGALGVWLIHSLTGGRWGDPLKHYFRSISKTLPLVFLLWIPVLFWLGKLYAWDMPGGLENASLVHKASYLNAPFFILRTIGYFIIWGGILYWLEFQNKRADLSGFLAVLYVLTGSFAAMDWVMSLLPEWVSTIFAILFITGQILFSFCFMIMILGFKDRRKDPMPAEKQVFLDLGNLILTMLMFWSYLAFSQFLIVWMGDKPEEISWYLSDMKEWSGMPVIIIAGHFFLPFFLLLNREWKRKPVFLCGLSALLVLMRVTHMSWLIFPKWQRGVFDLTGAHLGAALSVGVVYLIFLFRGLRSRVGD